MERDGLHENNTSIALPGKSRILGWIGEAWIFNPDFESVRHANHFDDAAGHHRIHCTKRGRIFQMPGLHSSCRLLD